MSKQKEINTFIIKNLLVFVFLTFFSCSDNKITLKLNNQNKVILNEQNVIKQVFNELYTYIIPGMNVSFNYPSHKRIFLNQGENEHQSENKQKLYLHLWVRM